MVGPDTALFAKRTRLWTSLGCGHGCSVLKTHYSMDVITFVAMDALCLKTDKSMDVIKFWAWMLCLKTDKTMDVIRLWAWMLCSQKH